MTFDPTLAMIRFGTGLGPRFAPPPSAVRMMSDLRGEDDMAQAFPVAGFATVEPSHAALIWINRQTRAARDTPSEEAAQAARQQLRALIGPARRTTHLAMLARAVDAPHGLRERLVAFWADHFTVIRRSSETAHLVGAFVEDAIRPHVAGRFSDMLRAVVTHPMMLLYLEQFRSIGPGSQRGRRRNAGLNENLARELLELHLLGVDGSYDQRDVRELAELLTGMTYGPQRGFYYDPARAEPGAETVLGRTFGADATLENVLAAMDDLARLPETVAHLARKMAVHFVADDPPADLVAAMTAAFDDRGDLGDLTNAMLAHPAAWAATRQKVRRPQEFITAALRALGVTGAEILRATNGDYRRLLTRPLRIMGQPWQEPPGPDGWPERAEDWIIPQGVAGRISWAMQAPIRIRPALPDPRDFVRDALGDLATEDVIFAANAAESRQDGVGVVLASAAFQRR